MKITDKIVWNWISISLKIDKNRLSSRTNSFSDFSLPQFDDKLMNPHSVFAFRVLTDNLAQPLCLFALPFLSRYKLLNKALLANWLASLDNASLKVSHSFSFSLFLCYSVSKFSLKPLHSFSFPFYSIALSSLFFIKNSVLQVLSFSLRIDCMSSTSLLWYQFPPAIPITRLPPSYRKRKIEYNDCGSWWLKVSSSTTEESCRHFKSFLI